MALKPTNSTAGEFVTIEETLDDKLSKVTIKDEIFKHKCKEFRVDTSHMKEEDSSSTRENRH